MPVDLVPTSLAIKIYEHKRDAIAWKPHFYQERALKFVLETSQSGLLLCPGLGKTSIILAMIKVLLKRRLMKRALVVAPLRAIYDVWPMEVSDWKDFNELGVAVVHGSAAQREKVLRQLRPEHQVVLTNFEEIPWLSGTKTRLAIFPVIPSLARYAPGLHTTICL